MKRPSRAQLLKWYRERHLQIAREKVARGLAEDREASSVRVLNSRIEQLNKEIDGLHDTNLICCQERHKLSQRIRTLVLAIKTMADQIPEEGAK